MDGVLQNKPIWALQKRFKFSSNLFSDCERESQSEETEKAI